MQRPSTLLAVTRNVAGESCYEFDYPAGTATPSYQKYLGMALRTANTGKMSHFFVGNDEPDPVRLQNYGTAGLGASQGQFVRADGSVKLGNNADLASVVHAHGAATGGMFKGVNENLTRPTQEVIPPNILWIQ